MAWPATQLHGGSADRLRSLIVTLTAGVLLTAAALKAAGGPTEGWGLRPHQVSVIAEVALASALLSGLLRQAVVWTACTVFVMFAVVNVVSIMSGRASCGCFGTVAVSPWVTLIVDTLLAGSLAWSAGTMSTGSVRLRRTRLALTTVLMTVAIAVVFRPRPFEPGPTPLASVDALGTVSGKLVVLSPEDWPRKPFTLADFIPNGVGLKSGRWVVLLYHDGCSTCERALSAFRDAMRPLDDDRPVLNRPKIALIEIASHGAAGTGNWGNLNAALSDKHDWFATTPIAVAVESGMVKAVVIGEAVVDASAFIERAGFTSVKTFGSGTTPPDRR